MRNADLQEKTKQFGSTVPWPSVIERWRNSAHAVREFPRT